MSLEKALGQNRPQKELRPGNSIEVLADNGIFFEDHYPIQDLSRYAKRKLAEQGLGGIDEVDAYVAEHKAEAIRLKQFVADFFVAHIQDIKNFFGLDSLPSDLKICFVPRILSDFDKKRMKGDYNGKYDPQERRLYVYAPQRSLQVNEDIDYARVAFHEYTHALSHELATGKSGFREDSSGNGFSAIDETMTEYVTKEFFASHHSGKQPRFNAEYLVDGPFIDGLKIVIGWEAVRDAYLSKESMASALERLSKLNKMNVVFNFKLLEDIYQFFGSAVDKVRLANILRGDKVVLRKRDFNEFKYRSNPNQEDVFAQQRAEFLAVVDRLPNVSLRE